MVLCEICGIFVENLDNHMDELHTNWDELMDDWDPENERKLVILL